MDNNINRTALLSELGKRLSPSPPASESSSSARQLPKTASPDILLKWLAEQPSKVSAKVVSSTPLTESQMAKLPKVNPELAGKLEQLLAKNSATTSLASKIDNARLTADPQALPGKNGSAAAANPLTVATVNKIINNANISVLMTVNKQPLTKLAIDGAKNLMAGDKAALKAALATQSMGINTQSATQAGSSPSLFAIKLLVGGQNLVSLSPTPLPKNSSVMLTSDALAGVIADSKTAKGQSPNLINNTTPANSLILKASPSAVGAMENTVANIIRQALPQENSSREMLSLLSRLDTITPSVKNTLLPDNITKLVQTIINSSLDTQQPIHQKELKESLLNSGLFLENKLAQASGTTAASLNGDKRVVLEKLVLLLANAQSLNGPKAIDDKLHLQGIEKIAELIASLSQPANNAATNAQAAKPDGLLWLLSALGIKLPQAALAQPEQLLSSLSQKLQQKMTHLAQANLSKIQLDQIKSLGVDKQSVDAFSASLHVELPLRWLDQVLPLTLHISQREEQNDEEQTDEDSDEGAKKVKRWQVMMSFDLPQNQRLHVQLSLVEDQCSALLWAESESLCNTAKAHLSELASTLETVGLNVDKIECYEGKPCSPVSPLAYQLVDVTT